MIIGISKKIELAANLAIILVACLLAVALVKNYLITRTTASTEQAGTRQEENRLVSAPTLTSLNINWKESRQTLVLALSSTCHFCAESSPFYKKLIESKKDARIVAVLPEPVQHGRSYLEKLGLAVDEIKQSSLDSIGVSTTPTLFLVDPSGNIKDFWIGKLSPDKEMDVLNRLQL